MARFPYSKLLFQKAGRDAWNIVFGQNLSTTLVGYLAVCAVIYVRRKTGDQTPEEVKDALESLGWGLAAYLAVYAVSFIAHFIYVTPRALYLDLLSKLPKHDARFVCDLSEATVSHRNIQDSDGEMNAWLAIKLRFVNRGEGTAKNLRIAVYSYWLLYPENIDKWGDELYGTWTPGDSFEYEFENRKSALAGGISPGMSKVFGFESQDTLVASVEIEFQTDSAPSAAVKNEPLWFWWNANNPAKIEPTNSAIVKSGTLKIEEFKGLGLDHHYKPLSL